ncbi:MAG: hypothetical protein ABH817_02625 [archaeon]
MKLEKIIQKFGGGWNEGLASITVLALLAGYLMISSCHNHIMKDYGSYKNWYKQEVLEATKAPGAFIQ